MTGGAEAGGEDVFLLKTGGEELGTISFAQVKANILRRRLVAGRHHVEPLERVGLFAAAGFVEVVGSICKLRGELGDKLGANLVAARSDGWADRREKVCRI